MLGGWLGARSLTGPHSSLHCFRELNWKVKLAGAMSRETKA